jgi:glycosyltransferase involved in cell wall biosynthesis
VDSSQQPVYSIVIPVLNEAVVLPDLLAELRRLDLLERAIFVDNGSSDGGPEVIAAAGGRVLHEGRRGYGFPCLTGARAAAAAGAHAVVFMEGDGTDDPREVRWLVGPVLAGVADLVIGCRTRAVRAAGGMPWHQRLGNGLISWLVARLYDLSLPDNGPFRAIRVDLLQAMGVSPSAFAFPIEVILRAHLAGARIVMRDPAYRERRGVSKIGGDWRRSLQAGVELVGAVIVLRLPPVSRRAAAAWGSCAPAGRRRQGSSRTG